MATDGKVALVTGASSGIGRAVASALLGSGYRVFLTGRRRQQLDEVAAGARPGMAIAQPADVTKPADVDGLFAAIHEKAGRLDLVFNNAGFFPKSLPIEDIPYA